MKGGDAVGTVIKSCPPDCLHDNGSGLSSGEHRAEQEVPETSADSPEVAEAKRRLLFEFQLLQRAVNQQDWPAAKFLMATVGPKLESLVCGQKES